MTHSGSKLISFDSISRAFRRSVHQLFKGHGLEFAVRSHPCDFLPLKEQLIVVLDRVGHMESLQQQNIILGKRFVRLEHVLPEQHEQAEKCMLKFEWTQNVPSV